MMTKLELLAPRLRKHQHAFQFADALAAAMGPDLIDKMDGCGSYVWDAEIPPPEKWCNEITKLVAHLESL